MIASGPWRSRSRCQISSASPTRRAASSASTSSQEPGNCRTAKRIRNARTRRGSTEHLDLVVLHQGIREQLLAEGLELGLLGDVELDETANMDVLDALEAECRQRSLDGHALRVEDAGLGPDQDASPHSAPVSASPSPNFLPALPS